MNTNKDLQVNVYDAAWVALLYKVTGEDVELGSIKLALEACKEAGINCNGAKNKNVMSIVDALPKQAIGLENSR